MKQIELSESLDKRFYKRLMDGRFYLIGKLSRFLLPKADRSSLDKLCTFCAFVGHGRSGGTLVGALLNAHPNIVISNELNALRRLNLGLGAQELFRLIYLVSKRQARRGSRGGGGYSYEVPGQWQGAHSDVTVIGDRKAGATAYEIVRDPTILDVLDAKIRLQKKFVHVIRNPFDSITTTLRNTRPLPSEGADQHLTREIRNYFARCQAVRLVQAKFGLDSVHRLYHEKLILEPIVQLKRLCAFLGVDPREDYLQACAGILVKTPHRSRETLGWSPSHVELVRDGIGSFSWLAEYLREKSP